MTRSVPSRRNARNRVNRKPRAVSSAPASASVPSRSSRRHASSSRASVGGVAGICAGAVGIIGSIAGGIVTCLRGGSRGGGRHKTLPGRASLPMRCAVYAAAAALALVVLTMMMQLLWPSDRFYPLATLDGYAVGGSSAQQVSDRLNDKVGKRTLTLTDATTGLNVELTPADAGISVDYADRAAQAVHHSWAQRLVPFHWLFSHKTGSDAPSAYQSAQDAVEAAATDASLTVDESGNLVAAPGKIGYTFAVADAVKALNASDAPFAATLDLKASEPAIATSAVEKLRDTVTQSAGDQVTFRYGEGTWQVPASTVFTWLSSAASNDDPSQIVLTINEEALSQGLKSSGISAQVAQSAVNAGTLPAVFAQENRVSRAIDTSTTSTALATMLTSGAAQPVDITVQQVDNPELYEGLPADGDINQQLDTLFAGADYAVSVTNLRTGERTLDISGDTVFTSASTYKLYVAYAMMHAVESGELTWDSPLNGMTLQQCMATMIVNSDNECPEAWLARYGFDTLTSQAQQLGATNTNFRVGDMRTTANDLATVLSGYYNGTIASANDLNTILFPLMQRQVYREGIPTGIGSSGIVQDKVGFMDGLLHDAAIVRCDKGDYAVVIMTDNASWFKIAQATLLIYDTW